ncbi:MAG: hypothetical protein HDQ89_04610 [Desulfovibrio sp.]|nr:hypothetical protein [Desulfovibrio sp.]
MDERLKYILRAKENAIKNNNKIMIDYAGEMEKKLLDEINRENMAKEYISNELGIVGENRDNIPIVNFFADGSYTLNGEKFIAKVKGIPTFELINVYKNNIHMMLKACRAELVNMVTNLLAPAPYYFERVAILARKSKNYELEIFICNMLIRAYDLYIKARIRYSLDTLLDPRKSPRYEKIVNRLPKAIDLYNRTIK